MKSIAFSFLAISILAGNSARAADMPVKAAPPAAEQCRLPGSANALLIDCGSFTVSVGAMYIQRYRPSPSAIVTPPTGTPGTVISGSDFRFDWHVSPEVVAQWRLGSG